MRKNLVENYLIKIQEKEWNEDDKWKEHFKIDLLANVISMDKKTGETDININRHSMQPVLLNLIKNIGGDYKGRKTTKNSKHVDFSGIEYILKNLPDGWEEKMKKYVEKITKKHNEE